MRYLALILLAASSYGPTTKNQTQLSTGKSTSGWFNMPDCAPDGGVHLNYKLDAGFVCATAGGGGAISPSSVAPGGSYPMVQFNAGDGGFGGADKVFIDGGNLGFNAMINAHPPAPVTDQMLKYNYVPASGMPALPQNLSNTLGIPVPEGTHWQFSQLGTAANWRVASCIPQGFGNSNVNMFGQQTAVTACTAAGGSCTATNVSWATTNLETMSPIVQGVTTVATNIWCGYLIAATPMWRGNTAGRGGFFFYHRMFIDQAANDGLAAHRTFVGLINRTSIIAGTTEPRTSALMTDFVGFANNTGENTLWVCDNDNVSTPTCSNLGANYPTTTGAWYDLWIWAWPNDSHIYYAVQRLDSAQSTSGEFNSADLPRNTVQLGWQTLMGTGTNDGGVLKYSFGGTTWAFNY